MTHEIIYPFTTSPVHELTHNLQHDTENPLKLVIDLGRTYYLENLLQISIEVTVAENNHLRPSLI